VGAIDLVIDIASGVLTGFGFTRAEWEWDIYLITTSDYKRDIRTTPFLSRERIDYLLFGSQPRFFWRCVLNVDRIPIMEVGVDATEFARSNPVFLVNHFYDVFADRFSDVVRRIPVSPEFHPLFREKLLNEYKQIS
jgi:hypothetical protein